MKMRSIICKIDVFILSFIQVDSVQNDIAFKHRKMEK